MTILTQSSVRTAADSPGANGDTQRFLLRNIDWRTYKGFGDLLPDRPGLRLTYDRGNLEFMSTSPKHEIYKKNMSRFMEMVAEAFNKPFVGAGNMTFQHEELDRGFEPDDCDWIDSEPAMRGKLTWDPTADPPPDLALEIEVSRSALNRMAIYAAFRIGEVWCFDGDELRVYRLQPNGTYQRVESSAVFPGINLDGLVPFIKMLETQDVLTVMRAFREWLRQQMGKSS